MTKSVYSMLVGQSLQRGALPGLSAPLSKLIPEALAQVPDSAAGAITLGQIMSGHSGVVHHWETQSDARQRHSRRVTPARCRRRTTR